MPRSLLVLFGTVLVVSGCAIPPRDNPRDPDNIPPPPLDPIIEMRVFAGIDEGSPEQSFGRRNQTFVLDASQTVDPEGRPLVFLWNLDGAPGFETPGLSLDSANKAVITPVMSAADYPVSGEGVAVLTFGLRVEAGVSSAETSVSIAISNDAPVIDPGEEIVVPADIGVTVTLDPCGDAIQCTSDDADGDRLQDFVWTQTAGEPLVALAAADTNGRVTFTAPTSPAVLQFELKASDGLATGLGRQVVRIGPQAWARTDERLLRLHVEQLASAPFTIADTSLTILAVEPGSGDFWVGGQSQTGGTYVRRVASDGFTVLDAWYIFSNGPGPISPLGTGAILAHDDGFSWLTAGGVVSDVITSPPIAVATDEGEGADAATGWYLSRMKLFQDTGSGTPTFVANVPGGGQFFPAELAVDVDGVPWVGANGNVFRLLGTSLQIRFPDQVEAMTPHRDDGLWVLRRDGADLEILHVRSSGQVENQGVLVGGDETLDPEIAYEGVSGTLWVMDGNDVFRLRDENGILGEPERFRWEEEMGLSPTEFPQFEELAPSARSACLGFSVTTFDPFADSGSASRLGCIHPDLVGASIVPGTSPKDAGIGDAHRLSIDPTRGIWFQEDFTPGATRMSARGTRLATAAFQDKSILGPFSTTDGSAFAFYYSQFGDTAGIAKVGPDGADLAEFDVSPLEVTSRAFAGNELAVCVVGKTSLSTGSPVRITTAGAKTVFSGLVWDPFHIGAAAISPDGATCWYSEDEGTPRIVTANGASAVRSGGLTQQTDALAADPRSGGGVWRADALGAITRFSGGAGSLTPISTPVTALAIEKVCDDPATPTCVYIWYAVPGAIVRSTSTGSVLQRYEVPGLVTDIVVR